MYGSINNAFKNIFNMVVRINLGIINIIIDEGFVRVLKD